MLHELHFPRKIVSLPLLLFLPFQMEILCKHCKWRIRNGRGIPVHSGILRESNGIQSETNDPLPEESIWTCYTRATLAARIIQAWPGWKSNFRFLFIILLSLHWELVWQVCTLLTFVMIELASSHVACSALKSFRRPAKEIVPFLPKDMLTEFLTKKVVLGKIL